MWDLDGEGHEGWAAPVLDVVIGGGVWTAISVIEGRGVARADAAAVDDGVAAAAPVDARDPDALEAPEGIAGGSSFVPV